MSGTEGGYFGKRCCLELFPENREKHRSSFLRSPSKLPNTSKKLRFHENSHGIQKNDPTYIDFMLPGIIFLFVRRTKLLTDIIFITQN